MKSITLRHSSGDSSASGGKTKRIATGVLQSITSLWFLFAKQKITTSRKLKDNSKISPMIKSPKNLIASISNKLIRFRHRKKRTGKLKDDGGGDLSDDGVWRRDILMGDKCQPLDFSGVIYYNRDGKRTEEFPVRSPRVSPLPSYVSKFDWVPTHNKRSPF